MAEVSMPQDPFSNGITNGHAAHSEEKKSHKSHKSHKEKKSKDHKHKKEKKEKKNKKDKHKDKHREKKSGNHGGMDIKSEPVIDTPVDLLSQPVKSERMEDEDAPLAGLKRKAVDSDDGDEDYKPTQKASSAKKVKQEVKKGPARRKSEPAPSKARGRVKPEPTADKKKTKRELAREQEEKEVWKWWEEEKKDDGTKWKTLEHNGPMFAPAYERLPDNVKLKYDGKPITLSADTEEVAGFYAKMLLHDYTSMEMFNKNFFKDWRKVMSNKERELITDLKKCDFKAMHAYFTEESEKRKGRSKEEKQKEKEKNEQLVEHYGYCQIDGHREKIGNFRIEPPGLFRGRGEHPKMGMLKRRVMPEDVVINCGKGGNIPKAPDGHRWKEVRSDNTVTWLASWTENVQGQIKYVMLNPASRLKGEKDWQKYEKARALHQIIDKVRANYSADLKSKEMRLRQRAVALYFIDKLALRAGNEKDSDEQADTVGCCSLRVEHIKLHDEQNGKENVVEFDFLGKDSIRYQNSVSVEKRVFKNVKLFMEDKAPSDDLFDRLNTTILNKHLQEIMEGLTAKVFRTYNASRTLEEQLNELTAADDPMAAKMLSYNRANRAVAVLCNHQRAVPKNFSAQMERMNEKITAKKHELKEANKALKDAKAQAKASRAATVQTNYEKKKKAVERVKEQLHKLEVAATDKDENKDIALGTSKLNYLDPRISVAWCKKHDVPIEKVYNKTQRQKFMWAIDMAGPEFQFIE